MERTLLIFLIGFLVGVQGQNENNFDLGTNQSIQAYDAVCWYEFLKIFPNTSSGQDGFLGCQGQAAFYKSQLSGEDDYKQYFGQWMIDNVMPKVPSDYMDACKSYLEDYNKGWNNQTNEYPFQGYSLCMPDKLKEKHGDKAITAVDAELLQNPDWREIILKRDNEFRARHGVPPFERDDKLDEEAQAWADKLAAECNMYHSENDDPGRQWKGSSTGESLSGGGKNPDGTDPGKIIAAYVASDGWYEEIGSYPYPDGYTGDNNDELFKSIGHFTQTVWKASKFVGYGYAYNGDCSGTNYYTVGRYSPPGNGKGEYQENVSPPNDS